MDSSSGGDSKSSARTPRTRSRRSRLLFEKRIALLAVLAALPGTAVFLILLWTHPWTRDGKTAAELELNACFEARNETLVALPYSTPNARWMVRQSSFRQNGVPHKLIVLSDVSRALREEERSAWQRLIRVLGHELNNSLAPIISIAGSLASRLPLPQLPEEQNADFQRGLNIIESRTASLHRFLQSYRRLAQMPSPTLQPVELRPLLERVAVLETRLKVEIAPGSERVLLIDPDLIEQMLINLVRNAVDAALEQAQSSQAS